MQTTPRVGGIEDLRDPSLLLNGYPSHAVLSPGRRPQPRKKPSPSRKASRTPKATPYIGSEGQTNGNLPEDDGEELTLAENAPEDDKYLFQLRKEFLSEKGKGMWEEMKAKYSEKHQGNWEKAALQMKVSRAVAKFGVWPEKEVKTSHPVPFPFMFAVLLTLTAHRNNDFKRPFSTTRRKDTSLSSPA
jgi:hypothetical protein